jgi:hypothetical protein
VRPREAGFVEGSFDGVDDVLRRDVAADQARRRDRAA